MKKVFVFGTGRCGTVSFNKLMGSIPNSFSMHEGIYKEGGQEIRKGDMKEFGKFLYYGERSEERVRDSRRLTSGETLDFMDKMFASRDRLIKKHSKDKILFCDVNPYGHYMINYIYKKHPDAFFIHLVRNGYDVVNSYHLREKTTYPPVPESTYRGYQSGKPRPLPPSPYYGYIWNRFDRLQKISWFWSRVNLDIENRMRAIPDEQKAIFRLEDLNNESFKKLLEKIGIPLEFNDKILSKKYNASNTKLKWTDENINKFNKLASDMMRKYRYELR